MALEVGSRLGHYDVTALIGEGGMGQVYQATDTKLNRQVALKILPEAFATDPDRLARFQREAQVLASLNHPGIAAIYGIEEADDTRALVLELVEGPTLADRIKQGPIPVDEALPIAKQIAEALKRFSDSPCTAWARRGTSACTNAGGPMQAYSMDLRERALLDSDAGMKAADVAVKYRVSGSWVRLLKQRRRETGEVAPRVQRHGRRRMLEPHLHTLAALIAEQPDRTLAELKDALGTPASLATIWRAVAALDVTVKKNGPALRTRST